MSCEPSYKYLFGPVPSRRLGRSLGIDLVPAKTCSLDCVYCQVGANPATTCTRGLYVPTAAVLAELDAWLRADGAADALTLSGAGEPTLHTEFGEVLRYVRARCPLTRVLLSNGTLFWQPDVRAAACAADIVKATLSAWDEASFQRLHRPHPDITFARLLEGVRALRAEFSGRLWLEVFVVAGHNDQPEQVARIAALAATLNPDEIHLNTAIRPPAQSDVHPVPAPQLTALCDLFTPRATPIGLFRARRAAAAAPEDTTQLLSLLARHPSTVEELAGATGRTAAGITAQLQALQTAGRVVVSLRHAIPYYQLPDPRGA